MVEEFNPLKNLEIEVNPNNPYLEYEGKPIILGASRDLIEEKEIRWTRIGNAILDLPTGEQITVPPDRQLDKIEPTFNAFLGNITPGSQYEERIVQEYKNYYEALAEDAQRLEYGNLVYYPEDITLAWFAPRELKMLGWLARNELILQDPELQISWIEQRQLLGSFVCGVIGASVGGDAFHRVIDTLRPGWAKIGDLDDFDDSNRQRVRFGYRDLGRNKAEVMARQIHDTDPWMPISVYPEGIHPGNIQDFFKGNQKIGEPSLDGIIEECDDPNLKIKASLLAREYQIPLWRITDLGEAWQLDYLPYDKVPNFPLTVGVTDIRLLKAKQEWEGNQANRELFFDFAFSLIGPHWQRVPEFKNFILDKNETPFTAGIPQLAIAAEGGASHAALSIAKTILGWEQPNRMFVNLGAKTIISEYQKFHSGAWFLIREATDLTKGLLTQEIIDIESSKIIGSKERNIRKNNLLEQLRIFFSRKRTILKDLT